MIVWYIVYMSFSSFVYFMFNNILLAIAFISSILIAALMASKPVAGVAMVRLVVAVKSSPCCAVIVTLPSLKHVTRPVAETFAMVESEEDHVRSALASEGVMDGVS